MSGNITIEKFSGDREAKDARIYVDGVYAGMITRINSDDFQTAASMRRTMRFVAVEVFVKVNGQFIETEFSAADGYSSASATKAAKAWAFAQLS